MSDTNIGEGVKALVKSLAPNACTQAPWSLVATVEIDGTQHRVAERGMVTASTHEQAFAVAVPWADAVLLAVGRGGALRAALLEIIASGPDAIKAAADAARAKRPEIAAEIDAACDAAVARTTREVRRVRVTIK